jgi:hypothetical protein
MRNANAKELQLATQQEGEQKERGGKTELQTTPNKEGKPKQDHCQLEKKFPRNSRLAIHSTSHRLSTGNPL